MSVACKRRGLFFRLHRREENDVADRRAVGEEHDETIQPHSEAARGRQAVLEGVDKVLVHLRVLVSRRALGFHLLEHTLFLIDRVVELRKGVSVFVPADKIFETFGKGGGGRLALGER